MIRTQSLQQLNNLISSISYATFYNYIKKFELKRENKTTKVGKALSFPKMLSLLDQHRLSPMIARILLRAPLSLTTFRVTKLDSKKKFPVNKPISFLRHISGIFKLQLHRYCCQIKDE
jgi:hypothetical protein